MGRPRRVVHHRAEHLRRDVVVRELGRLRRRGDGRPARVQGGAPVLRRPRQGRRREGRGQLELQRVPDAVQGQQGGHVVRRHRRGRPARGGRQRREGEERLRAGAGQGDARLGLAVVVGARDARDLEQGGPRLEVHLVRDRSSVPQAGRVEDPGRMGRDPARHPQVDLRDPGVQGGGRRVRPAHARLDRGRADRQPRHDASGRVSRVSSTSASRSSRTSATSAPSSSPR